MKDYIVERGLQSAAYVIANKATVRACALKFDVSKSTVHKDLTERLDKIDADLRKKVKAVLDVNLNERHIRGGTATKEKYKSENAQ